LGKAGLTRSLEDVGWIWSSSYQLLELINSLLDLSKIEAGHMELDIHSFSLPSLMAETEALLTPLAKRGNNTLSVHVDPALDTINGDSTKLRQCLLNLGSNACKFTKDGFVELHARAEGNTLVLEVSDTGIGLSEETIAKLFKPFVQSDSSTTRNYGGTGLGLALVDRFGKMMGGNVSVVSEPGYGSVFALHVPLDMGEPARQSAPQSQKPVQKTQRSQPLALVVEDEPSSLELLRRMLERNGYDVMQASDGHTALEMALDALPDVILLDITLPRLDGWAVLDQMAQDPQLAAIPTIVISVDDRKRISLEKGASDHLVKPVKVDELEDILRLYSIPHAGRILLVEDDDATANLYKSGLEQAGYVVERTDNAHIGLERARNGSFGLVIADLHLPDSDAFAMIEAIADITTPARLPVLIITGRSLTPEKRQELEAHSQAIVLKSGLSPRMLVANVQEMLRAA
jgi:DNA-binding response OmpR family regulator